jgi:hypothetical protein
MQHEQSTKKTRRIPVWRRFSIVVYRFNGTSFPFSPELFVAMRRGGMWGWKIIPRNMEN